MNPQLPADVPAIPGPPCPTPAEVLTTAQTLYNIALDTYCQETGDPRQGHWIWDMQEPARKVAWLAVAKHVLHTYPTQTR